MSTGEPPPVVYAVKSKPVVADPPLPKPHPPPTQQSQKLPTLTPAPVRKEPVEESSSSIKSNGEQQQQQHVDVAAHNMMDNEEPHSSKILSAALNGQRPNKDHFVSSTVTLGSRPDAKLLGGGGGGVRRASLGEVGGKVLLQGNSIC
jgi:hypothetical protein